MCKNMFFMSSIRGGGDNYVKKQKYRIRIFKESELRSVQYTVLSVCRESNGGGAGGGGSVTVPGKEYIFVIEGSVLRCP